MNFSVIRAAVASQWERMQKHNLFTTAISGDVLWTIYLSSFPPGTNPVLRVRTEHDCGCCKQFIRAVGNTVSIIDGRIVTLWDITAGEFQPIVDALAKVVRNSAVVDMFLHDHKTAGTDKNFQQLIDSVQTWTHFFVNIDSRYVAKEIPTRLSELRSTRDVFVRSLEEIGDDAVETVLDLISQGSLYRGEEHKGVVTAFLEAKKQYSTLTGPDKILFTWTGSGALARIKNTVIGTLLVDLSEGKEIDQAVASYEAKVAPTNYKRPTALITRGMIDKAKATLTELGMTSALERRYAVLKDITINNVLFANRNTRKVITNVLDDLAPTAPAKVSDKTEEVTIERFLADILPKANSVEVLLENRHNSNLVSLIAPVDATAVNMFKWPNRFSWSYNGDVADSIKERVKKAGGNINADLCCRLAWYNYDDLDLHLESPLGHICYVSRKAGSGQLDVDMNAGSGQTREAVENIFYQKNIPEGSYHLYINQYSQRETKDVGFEVEIDYLGTVRHYHYDKAVKGNVTVAKWWYSPSGGMVISEGLTASETVKTLWNLPTQSYHPVSAIMLSPNHWDGAGIGNKHYFFMLEGCKNDGSARGFYNEFLSPQLDKHRRVLEVVGSRMKAEGDNQLSGLGFSYKDNLTCRVKGSFTRTVKVQF